MPELYTIGHSNHAPDDFVALLQRHRVEFVVDVRAVPYSRRFPWFRKAALAASLAKRGIAYRWMGDRLGGIRRGGTFASFAAAAASPAFGAALDDLEALAGSAVTAIMCAEREPLDCHRTVLVTRHLRQRDLAIRHILASGAAEPNDVFERRLVEATRTTAAPLLESPDDTIEAAYAARAARMEEG